MNAIIGYILSGLGIVTLALSQEKVKSGLSITFLNALSPKVLLAVGGVLVIAGLGVLIASNKSSGSSIPQEKEEVPIYEGEGKHRKIVGYRKG
ncbi:MAG: hypothetical protein WCI72_03220 [archaeon]